MKCQATVEITPIAWQLQRDVQLFGEFMRLYMDDSTVPSEAGHRLDNGVNTSSKEDTLSKTCARIVGLLLFSTWLTA